MPFNSNAFFHFVLKTTPGYLTEKLTQAAAAQTIPIYWGDTHLQGNIESSGGGGKYKSSCVCA
ncbi:hypothetical protein [uncultured Helicobacter sp.]|uniref:hypothetical protein n=1 Tax=uncultured Helicobacter sp. TaxID=175537 RepID=UPI0025F0F576|nr:hypothetical protein [uncultured Helicobacter sp.]